MDWEERLDQWELELELKERLEGSDWVTLERASADTGASQSLRCRNHGIEMVQVGHWGWGKPGRGWPGRGWPGRGSRGGGGWDGAALTRVIPRISF